MEDSHTSNQLLRIALAPLAKGFVRYRWLSESQILVFQINRHPKSPTHAYHNTRYACQAIYYICIGKSTGRESPKRTSCMSVPGPGQFRRHLRLPGAARCSFAGFALMQIHAQGKGTGSPSRDRPMHRDHVQWRVVGAERHKPSLFRENRGHGELTERYFDKRPQKGILHCGRICHFEGIMNIVMKWHPHWTNCIKSRPLVGWPRPLTERSGV
jgi:hypothetical protein